MPALLSHYRPDDQIFTFTENRAVQRRLALYHGVTALHMRFGETADETFDRCALPDPLCSDSQPIEEGLKDQSRHKNRAELFVLCSIR